MDAIVWILEPIQIWLRGGSWDQISASDGFRSLAGLAAFLVPSSIIMLGIGLDHWRDTPLAQWFGFGGEAPDEDWAERARDIDKDGMPDF
ncbi:MAG: hypothetical protein GC189_00850 [Alphaproteobacteria bacterium]|nr:hypothetical protein [Alphaproteobacteria bacterium]